MADGRDGSDGPFVLLGTVTRAHGLRGEVKVRPLTESPASFRRYREVYLSAADGAEKTAATVQAARVSGQAVVMQLAGYDSREAAERLAGSRVPDKFEAQPAAFFEAVRAGYARRASQQPRRFARIDADQPRDAVWRDVRAAVQARGWL